MTSGLAILERANEILADESRWEKGIAGRDGACCLVIAMDRASKGCGTVVFDAAMKCLYSHLPSEYDGAASHFNDAPTTTFADIKALLASAIAELREKQQ